MNRRRISEIMPNIFDIDPPTIQGDDPVVVTASLIKKVEVHQHPRGRTI